MLDVAGELKRLIDSTRGKHLSKIGSGTSRKVYRINTDRFGSRYNGKVVKYAKTKRSVKDNRKEFSTWMNVKGTSLEQDFCPIRDRSQNFEFLIMDYARPTSTTRRGDLQEIQNRLMRKYELESSIFDLHDANFGHHDKYGIVLIDYPWGGDFQHQSHNK